MTAFPLLAKELTEIAARRRTYVTRVVYGLLLYGVFAAINFSALKRASLSPMNAMGAGREMFMVLIFLQIIGIYLFLPAMTAGLITQEKERDSLVLLFLTELKPWQILLQKYASGLVAIVSFMLIGMPLGALCYAYGGVPPEQLFIGVWVLFLTCLQVAAFALMCSCRARTTVGAFIGTYIGQVVLFFGLGLFGEFLNRVLGDYDFPDKLLHVFLAYPQTLLFWVASAPYSGLGSPVTGTSSFVSWALLRSLPSLGATVLFLLIARFYFVRRAFAPARNRLLGLFRRLDSFMQYTNRWIGGVTFRTRDRELPGDDPIAWREMSRTTLGRPQYLARIFLALEIPTLVLCFWAMIEGGGGNTATLSELAAVLGTLAVVVLSAFSANAFVSERVNQTFEVLLTTSLHASDIVRQKARMLTRFKWVLGLPVMTVFAVKWWIVSDLHSWSSKGPYHDDPNLYLLTAMLTLAVYLPLVQWLSLWIGLKMRTRFRAILTALGVVVAWCVVPILACIVLQIDTERSLGGIVLGLSSPLGVPFINEASDLRGIFGQAPLVGISINFLIYGAIAAFIRHRCLSRADRYLRG